LHNLLGIAAIVGIMRNVYRRDYAYIVVFDPWIVVRFPRSVCRISDGPIVRLASVRRGLINLVT